jgi:hypothetical protein
VSERVKEVRFLQSGGVAGAVRGVEYDVATMISDDAQALADLVNESGLTLSGEFLSPASRDARVYEIHLVFEVRTVSVTFDDGTLPEQARALVGFLRRNANPRPLE